MDIEWDAEKDAANRAKHGVSLAEAAALDWNVGLTTQDVRKYYGEMRHIRYALLNGRLHSCVFTDRTGAIRIISLRKSNRREIKKYGPAPTNTDDQ
jgi:uncharacterized protein